MPVVGSSSSLVLTRIACDRRCNCTPPRADAPRSTGRRRNFLPWNRLLASRRTTLPSPSSFSPVSFFGERKKSGMGSMGGFKDRAVSRPLLGFCSPLSFYLSLVSLFCPLLSFARLELVMEDTREEALKGLYTLGHVRFLRFFLRLLVVSYRSLISNYPRFFGNFGNFKKSITWEKYQTPNNTSIPRNI